MNRNCTPSSFAIPPKEVFFHVVVKGVPLIDSLQLPVAFVLRLPREVGFPFGVFLLILVGVVPFIVRIGVRVVVIVPPDQVRWVVIVLLTPLSVNVPSVPVTPASIPRPLGIPQFHRCIYLGGGFILPSLRRCIINGMVVIPPRALR